MNAEVVVAEYALRHTDLDKHMRRPPQTRWQVTLVIGNDHFPIDPLRYDNATRESASKYAHKLRDGLRSVPADYDLRVIPLPTIPVQ